MRSIAEVTGFLHTRAAKKRPKKGAFSPWSTAAPLCVRGAERVAVWQPPGQLLGAAGPCPDGTHKAQYAREALTQAAVRPPVTTRHRRCCARSKTYTPLYPPYTPVHSQPPWRGEVTQGRGQAVQQRPTTPLVLFAEEFRSTGEHSRPAEALCLHAAQPPAL